MPAESHAWTISDVGSSEGPSSGDRHKPDGQIDLQMSLEARQAVPTQGPNKFFDINPAPGPVDVTDPELEGCIPEPFAGDKGQPVDFNAVAPEAQVDRMLGPNGYDLDGEGTSEASDISAAFGG